MNISARQLHSSAFVQEVVSALEQSGAAPEKLVLELTESQLLQDIDTIIDKMQQLNTLGVRFSLDDFGTGYSSLSYLKLLPLKQLKIDRSFITSLGVSSRDEPLVQAMINMARGLGLKTVAEGIENEATAQLLTRLGCDEGQGYYWSPAVPEDKLPALLRARI